jgi:hypothetical protein
VSGGALEAVREMNDGKVNADAKRRFPSNLVRPQNALRRNSLVASPFDDGIEEILDFLAICVMGSRGKHSSLFVRGIAIHSSCPTLQIIHGVPAGHSGVDQVRPGACTFPDVVPRD